MPRLEIEIPEQTLGQLAMEADDFARTMKSMAALKMYELGRLSSQEAAALAGISRIEFLQLLRVHQIPPFERVDETGALTGPIEELPDVEVLRLSRLRMPGWQSRRLQELMERQKENTLTAEEQQELAQLLRLNDTALVLKSEAMVEAVRRGVCDAARAE